MQQNQQNQQALCTADATATATTTAAEISDIVRGVFRSSLDADAQALSHVGPGADTSAVDWPVVYGEHRSRAIEEARLVLEAAIRTA
jgi:hypothetical protein